MTIQLRVDPESGKKDIIIGLKSDEDALPHEHEQQHRNLVDRLIEGGVVSEDELGKVIIEREEEEAIPQTPIGEGAVEGRQAEAEGQ